MKPILILRHSDSVPPGYLGEVLADEGIAHEVVALDEGHGLPGVDGWAAVVSLGGVMGAYDEDKYPVLVEEKQFLREAVEQGVPVLGICLGCQMLADALGGAAYKAPHLEVAYAPIPLSAAGEQDPVVRELDGSTLTWHQDTWDPPPGATLLAESDHYPQAFRYGSAVGIQPHPEASATIVRQWAESAHGADHLATLGIDRTEFLARIEADADAAAQQAGRLFGAWIQEVRGVAG